MIKLDPICADFSSPSKLPVNWSTKDWYNALNSGLFTSGLYLSVNDWVGCCFGVEILLVRGMVGAGCVNAVVVAGCCVGVWKIDGLTLVKVGFAAGCCVGADVTDVFGCVKLGAVAGCWVGCCTWTVLPKKTLDTSLSLRTLESVSNLEPTLLSPRLGFSCLSPLARFNNEAAIIASSAFNWFRRYLPFSASSNDAFVLLKS